MILTIRNGGIDGNMTRFDLQKELPAHIKVDELFDFLESYSGHLDSKGCTEGTYRGVQFCIEYSCVWFDEKENKTVHLPVNHNDSWDEILLLWIVVGERLIQVGDFLSKIR